MPSTWGVVAGAGLIGTTGRALQNLRLEDASERTLQLAGMEGIEQVWKFEKKLRIPGLEGTTSCRRLRGFVQKDLVAKLLDHVQRSKRYNTQRDSVDDMVSFEYYPMINGTWLDSLGEIFDDLLQHVLLPYVRTAYNCKSCAVGDILIRRYLADERRTHQLHFDSHAFATVVLGLTPPDEYQGGLYVQPTPHVRSRRFVHLDPGDVFVHSFDLQHGARVWQGARHSLVLWIKSSEKAVAEGTTPWYDEAAATGDPDAMFNVATQYLQGAAGEVDLQKALT